MAESQPTGVVLYVVNSALAFAAGFRLLASSYSASAKSAQNYYFWKLNESAPNDIDCVVNANVLFLCWREPEYPSRDRLFD